jgi:hypothetical protein
VIAALSVAAGAVSLLLLASLGDAKPVPRPAPAVVANDVVANEPV